MSIITFIRSELLARKGNWRKICEETNLSYWWLIKFAQGRISNPGMKNLEVLRTYLEKEGAILRKTEEPNER
ncbi:hypothetical protein [Burkholderia multivorans]|uniref:hypothetical protein n=1 Tax=Burkholderia multivorans TaxID=87883 RepID=UPI001C21F906|nr:hypothetical protein [Burkholderia multivorans]MBU9413522.1 hypothetical protein [Burkholderia multivorans]